MLDLSKRRLKRVCDILQELVPGREVWAFGSRVKGTHRSYSDLDLVVLGEGELPVRTMNRLVEAFEDSDLPIRVDVLDWNSISPAFQQIIIKDYIVVQEGKLKRTSLQGLYREPIILTTRNPLLRSLEWRPWKKKGYRILAADGVTVWHERDAIRLRVLETFAEVDADIFLFGSHAQGMSQERSDYDVGYWTEQKIKPQKLAALAEQLEEWPIPARVDLVDFSRLQSSFVEIALQGGVEIWKQRRQNSLFA